MTDLAELIHEDVTETLNLDQVYLRPSVKLEPLVDRWYAWPHLIAPAQQAMNLAFRYLPSVRSFINAPAVHLAAAKDPKMFGGPFVDLPATSLADAKEYVSNTERKRAKALAFAQQYRDFDLSIQSCANGYSLNELYRQLPPELKGRVELVYSLNNQPKIRVLEEMFLDDDMGLSEAQEILLHDTADADRAFFLSTPRFGCPGGVFIQTTFDGEVAGLLSKSRYKPINLRDLADRINKPVEALAPFFTNEAPPKNGNRYDGDGVRIRYFGHACILIETAEVSILMDPTYAVERVDGERHFRLQDLPDYIDFVALSHSHQDHMCVEALIQLRDRVGTVIVPPNNTGDLADPSMKRGLRALGFKSVVIMDPLDEFDLPGGKLTALPFSGEHCDLDIHTKQCFLIELKGRKLSLLVDSDAIDIEIYKRLTHRLIDTDIMMVGMECNGAPLTWLYGPLLSNPTSKKNDNSRRLSGANCGQAWNLIETIKPKAAYVYAMGQEPWMKYVMGLNYTEDSIQLMESSAFVSKCMDANIDSERLKMFKEFHL